MNAQEKFLAETPLVWGKNSIILRGLKKLTAELTSIKTLFIAATFVGIFYGKIDDLTGLIIGLAALGVKEIPSEVFSALVNKFGVK
jgi:hypothetical protein